MLRAAAGVLIFALALSVATAAQARYASIVIDYDTGRVLHESNADTRNYPASLAKMMTLYLAFEALERGDITLDKKLKVSRRAAGMPAAKLGLKRGETITVKNAILALITKSANDAAVVVAEALGEKETRFARMMTRKAKALGMKRTQFRNASGLPNRRQLSTARDMATLARALIRDFPKYYRLFATKEFVYKGKRYRNHNRLLRKYAGADGIKTGYIRASGFNLAASVSRNGRRLIEVVFGGKTPIFEQAELARLGYGIVVYANAPLQAAMLATKHVLAHLRAHGSTNGIEDELLPFDERQAVVGKASYDAIERRYAVADGD